jgi:competence protein ComEA
MLTGLDGARANPPTSSQPHGDANGPGASSAASSVQAGQSAPSPDASATSSAASPLALAVQDPCSAGHTPDGKVILNLATMVDLRTLPNIGQKRAQAILTLRDKLKKFHRVQELRRVKGIGAKTLQKLSPKILIDPPPGSCSTAAGDSAKKT